MDGLSASFRYILPPIIVVVCLFLFVMTNQSINFALRLVISTMVPAVVAVGYVVVLMLHNRKNNELQES
jgi:chromate transport protein ChrA